MYSASSSPWAAPPSMAGEGKISNPQPPPPTTDYHPAQSVSNIRNEIPIILDWEKSQYSNWVGLFEIHCHAYNVLDDIDPSTPHSSISDAMWTRLDSTVKKWIYGTISMDLLQTMLYRGATTLEIVSRLSFKIINTLEPYIWKINSIPCIYRIFHIFPHIVNN